MKNVLEESQAVDAGTIWFHGSGWNNHADGRGSAELRRPSVERPLFLTRFPAFASRHMSVSGGTFFIFKVSSGIELFDLHSDCGKLGLPRFLSKKLSRREDLDSALVDAEPLMRACLIMMLRKTGNDEQERVEAERRAYVEEKKKKAAYLMKSNPRLYEIAVAQAERDAKTDIPNSSCPAGALVFDRKSVEDAVWNENRLLDYVMYRHPEWSGDEWTPAEVKKSLLMDKPGAFPSENECVEFLQWAKSLPPEVLRSLVFIRKDDIRGIDLAFTSIESRYSVAALVWKKIAGFGFQGALMDDRGFQTVALFTIDPIEWVSNRRRPLSAAQLDEFLEFLGIMSGNGDRPVGAGEVETFMRKLVRR